MKKWTVYVAIILFFNSFGQTVEKYSLDNGGDSVNTANLQVLYSMGEVFVREIDESSNSISQGFINSDFKIKINPVVFLQGPSQNPTIVGLMNDDLRQNTLIPTISPYHDNATCSSTVFNVTGDNAIVDWVWVELRAANDNQKLINAQSALLQRDGDVVGLDGVSPLQMFAPPSNHYVVVNHRNHLGVMSLNTVALNSINETIINFTDNSFDTYGNNAQVQLSAGDMALWAGDVNGNKQIRYLGPGNDTNAIKDSVLGHSGNTTNSNFYPFVGYNNADINMNGQIRYLGPGNDTNILKDIILSHPDNNTISNFYPFNEQIPN